MIVLNVEGFVEFSLLSVIMEKSLKAFMEENGIKWTLEFMPIGSMLSNDKYSDYIPVIHVDNEEHAVLLSLRFGLQSYK